MKILVAIKRVVDYNVRVQVKPDGSDVAIDGVKMSINPFDEIAIEEALRFKEKGLADEVVAVAIGSNDSQQQLRTAMAMGADRSILVEADAQLQALDAAKVLLKVISEEQPGLVLMGKQAIDDDNGQVPQMVAALWNRPQATFASELELNGEVLKVTREVDAGLQTIEVDLPAVVSVDLRLNEPRFVKLPDIMKAKRKPLAVKPVAELLPEVGANAVTSVAYEPPQSRQKGVMVESVDELVNLLKEKGLVS